MMTKQKNNIKPKLVLISGGTASGKTMIAKSVASEFLNKNGSVTLIALDNYYKTHRDFNLSKEEINWDHPDSLRWDELLKDVFDILKGKTIKRNKYDFENSDYSNKVLTLYPANYVIVEGLYALYNKKINDLADLKIYISSVNENRFSRRLIRDKKIRYSNFDTKNFEKKWNDTIMPMHIKYISPTKNNANIIINNRDNNDPNAHESTDIILSLLR